MLTFYTNNNFFYNIVKILTLTLSTHLFSIKKLGRVHDILEEIVNKLIRTYSPITSLVEKEVLLLKEFFSKHTIFF